MHPLHAPERVNPLSFAPAEEVRSGPRVSRPRIAITNVDGEVFDLTGPLYGGLSLTGPLDPVDSRAGRLIQADRPP